MKNKVVHVRVNEDLKNNVESILDELGVSLSYAINMYLKQIEKRRGTPFDVILPSQEKNKEIEILAKAINLTGGEEVSCTQIKSLTSMLKMLLIMKPPFLH